MEAPQEVEIKKVFPAIGALRVKITSKDKATNNAAAMKLCKTCQGVQRLA